MQEFPTNVIIYEGWMSVHPPAYECDQRVANKWPISIRNFTDFFFFQPKCYSACTDFWKKEREESKNEERKRRGMKEKKRNM